MNPAANRSPKGFVDFKDIKARVNITQVLEHYRLLDELRQNGDRFSGPCPIHRGSNPTQFRVSISRNCFNCFGQCGRGGNVIDFVSMMEEISFRDAALLMQQWFLPGEVVSENSTPPAAKRPKVYHHPVDEDHKEDSGEGNAEDQNIPLTFSLKTLETDHPYLDERGISDEAVQHFGLGYCKRGCLRGHLVIPIHNPSGDLVGYVGRWPGEVLAPRPKYKFPKGFKKSLEVFNLHRATTEPEELPLVIVEGFFDCISLWEAGIQKCVSLMGSHLSETQAERIVESIPEGSQIELLFDADKAGRKGAELAESLLGAYTQVRRIDLPEEGMQPDYLTADQIAEVFE